MRPHTSPSLARAAAALAGALVTTVAQAQTPSVPEFPNADRTAVAEHLNAARILAGNENRQHFYRACIYAQVYPMYADSAQAPYLLPPQQVFDNLYWVGQGAVSAWVLKTSAGLLLLDSLPSATQVQSILLPGMRTLGLDPTQIRHVVLSNENADHTGGARYLQDTYGAKVWASSPAWTAIEATAGGPRRDGVISDGQTLAFGDTTLRAFSMPGITEGGLALVLPVTDKGTRRTAAYHASLAIPASVPAKTLHLQSLERFAQASRAAGVDTLLSAYAAEDLSLYGHDLLRHRRSFVRSPRSANDFQDPHPYVMTPDRYQRFLQITAQCVRVAAAREGQVLPQ